MMDVTPAIVFSPVSRATARNITCGAPAGAAGSVYGADVTIELSPSNVEVIAMESGEPSAMNIPPPSGRATTVNRLTTESVVSASAVPDHVPATAAGVNAVADAAADVAAAEVSGAASSFGVHAARATANVTSPTERIDMTGSSEETLLRSTSVCFMKLGTVGAVG